MFFTISFTAPCFNVFQWHMKEWKNEKISREVKKISTSTFQHWSLLQFLFTIGFWNEISAILHSLVIIFLLREQSREFEVVEEILAKPILPTNSSQTCGIKRVGIIFSGAWLCNCMRASIALKRENKFAQVLIHHSSSLGKEINVQCKQQSAARL